MGVWRVQAGPFRHRAFRRFFAGYATSVFGDGMAPVGVAFAILDSGGSAGELGFLLAMTIVATIAALLFGGVVADRVGRRPVMLAADTVRCLTLAAFATVVFAGHPQEWVLAVLLVLMGAAGGFFMPALVALTPQLVESDELHDANVMTGLAKDLGVVGGPALAGAIVALSSAAVVVAIDAGTYAVSVISLAAIGSLQHNDAGSRSILGELRDGWRAWSSRSWIWITDLRFALFNAILFAPWLVLGPVIAKQRLGGAAAWGIVLALQGAGAVLGGLAIRRRRPRRAMVFVTLVQTLWALPVAALALHLSLWPVAAGTLLAGASSAMVLAVWTTTLQQNVPPGLLARVSSYDTLAAFALGPIGLAAAGPLASAIGTSGLLWCGATFQAASAVALLAVPAIRRFDQGPTRSQRDPATNARKAEKERS